MKLAPKIVGWRLLALIGNCIATPVVAKWEGELPDDRAIEKKA